MKTTFKVDSFFRKMKRLGLAVTYNDVRLRTGYSGTDPKDASISTQFSRNVPLNCPLVSAAMDTVTEAPMAIAMAMLGGLGIIHKALTPKNQVRQVRKVRLHLNCRIDKPICVLGHETIAEILNRRDDKGYSFHSFPVLDNVGKIVGLLTRDDFDLCDGGKVTAAKAMTPLKELVTAKPNTSAEKAHAIMKLAHKKILPLITGTGKLVGMYVFSDLQRLVSGQYPLYNIDAEGHLRVGAAIDVGQEELERAEMLMAAGCDVLVIDKAHGDQRPVREMMISLKRLKGKHPGCDIVVGNISEPESAVRLARWGADGIKVGQGGGSICTTRIKTGIGCPQVTAVYNCARAIRDRGIPICADGGITQPGDVPIAIGAGAASVMMGLMLAGTDEAPGEIKETKAGRVKEYRGMGSLAAMKQSRAARARYRQDNVPQDKLVAEGVVSVVPYQGKVARILTDQISYLRAGMGYIGATSISELQRKADFRRNTQAGEKESSPHNITITSQ